MMLFPHDCALIIDFLLFSIKLVTNTPTSPPIG